jgi:hypothetical protein
LRTPHREPLFALALLLIGSLACSLFFPASPTAPAPVTETAPAETVTPAPLHESVTLTSVHFEETGQSPNYTITSETPTLTGVDDPRVQTFNSLARGIVEKDVSEFRIGLANQPAEPYTSGSFIDVGYEVLSPPGEVLSLKFNVAGYSDGAAHPYHYSQTLNFDLEQGREISLDELFQPGSGYLGALSEACKAELSKRDIAFDAFTTGADPTPENYRNWNLTAGGLLITFDEYQVAPYAAGPQTVLIPYAGLASILDLSGPAAGLIP